MGTLASQPCCPTDLPAENVSDFSVAPGAQNEFLVRYTDSRGLGAQDFTLSASEGQLSTSTLHLQPNTTATVTVSTAPGSHAVTLTASTGGVSRQATTTVTTATPATQLPEITATPTVKSARTKTGLRIRSLRFAGLPDGARVAVVCMKRAITLKRLRNKVLKRGQSLSFAITKPGYIGERVTLTVVKHAFTTRRVLIPPG